MDCHSTLCEIEPELLFMIIFNKLYITRHDNCTCECLASCNFPPALGLGKQQPDSHLSDLATFFASAACLKTCLEPICSNHQNYPAQLGSLLLAFISGRGAASQGGCGAGLAQDLGAAAPGGLQRAVGATAVPGARGAAGGNSQRGWHRRRRQGTLYDSKVSG